MKYVLLTITDETQRIRKWDWFVASSDSHYKNTRSFYNDSSISITVYSNDEIEDFNNKVTLLCRGSSKENIDILKNVDILL